jgi:RHS repeat-associated protein
VQSQGGATNTIGYGSGTTAYNPTSTTQDSNIASGGSYKSNTVSYGYDGLGNTTSSSTTSSGGTVSATLTYNTSGSNTDGTIATALAPGNGTNKTVYNYNTDHQLTSITPVTGAGLGVKAFTYDPFGRLKTETDGAGNTTTYTYDNDDRQLTTAFSDSTGTVTNTYDAAGNLLTQASATGTVTNTYDQVSRLTSTSNSAGGGTISYGYDKASNQVSETDALGTYTNTFDDSGVLLVTKYPKSGGYLYTDYATDDHGRRTDTFLQGSSTYSNTSPVTVPSSYAARYTTTYDPNGRVSEIKAVSNNSGTLTTTFDTSYCYNAAAGTSSCSATKASDTSKIQWEKNNLTSQITAFTYDGSRIKTVAQSGGSSNTTWNYTYDSRGNRLTATATGGTTSSQTLTYNAANEITTTGYTFDGAGNLTAAPGWTYTYNAAEQMIAAKNTSTNVTTTYTYAGASQTQVLTEVNPAGSTYTITYGKADANGQPEIDQYKVNSAFSSVYSDPVTGQSTMLQTSSGIECMYVFDGQGNPVGLLTDFATQGFNIAYDPYGVGTFSGSGNGNSQNPYTFKGGIQDRATGLIKFGIRWYNPTTGTWTQEDTLDAPLDPSNANRYAFAGDDPINGFDPSGESSFGAYAGACGLGAGENLGLGLGLGTITSGVGLGVALGVGCAEGVIGQAIADNVPSASNGYSAVDDEFDVVSFGLQLVKVLK